MVDKKEQIDKMPEVVDDNEGKVSVEELKDILENDIKAYEKSIPKLKADIENYKEQVKLDYELWDLLSNPETYKKIEPTFEFEKNPKFWELQFKKNQYKIRQEKARVDGQLNQYKYQLEAQEKDLADKKEKLAKLMEGDKDE